MTEKYSHCSIIQHLINARCTRHAESPQLATQLRLLAICGRCSRGSAADVSSSSCRHCSRLFPGRFVVAFFRFLLLLLFLAIKILYTNLFFLFILVFIFVSFVLPFWRNKFKEITYFFLMNAVLSALRPMQGIGGRRYKGGSHSSVHRNYTDLKRTAKNLKRSTDRVVSILFGYKAYDVCSSYGV